MREIRFRGKTDCGKWVYGYFTLNDDDKACIIPEADPSGFWREVDPATIGQSTGLKDKNGQEIYEGDIYDAPHDFGPGGFSIRRGVVVWDNESGYNWHYWKVADLEVIGNIYENPELLEEGSHA